MHIITSPLCLIFSVIYPVTGLATGRPANATEAYYHEFALTLSTMLSCDVPLLASCEANDNQLSGSQWDAARVSLPVSVAHSGSF